MADKNVVQIVIEGNNITAVKSIEGVETKLKGLKSTMSGSGGLDSVLNQFGLSMNKLSAGAALGFFEELIRRSINTAEELGHMSEKVGISVESLSTLKFAAQMADVPFETLTNAIGKFSKAAYTAVNGNADMQKRFSDLGISIADSNGKFKSTDQLLLEVSDKFRNMPDGIRKTGLAMELFGKSGKEIIPLLNSDIRQLQEEARNLGLEISSNTAAQAEALHQNLKILEGAVQGAGLALAKDLMPALIAASTNMVSTGTGAKNTSPIIETLSIIVRGLALALGAVATTGMIAGTALGTYGAVMAKLVTLHPGDALKAAEIGFQRIKDVASSFGKTVDALVHPEKYQPLMDAQKKYQQELDDANIKNKAAAEAEKKWETEKLTIKQKTLMAGLDPESKKLQEIYNWAEKTKEEYKLIGEAAAVINKSLNDQIAQEFKPKLKPLDLHVNTGFITAEIQREFPMLAEYMASKGGLKVPVFLESIIDMNDKGVQMGYLLGEGISKGVRIKGKDIQFIPQDSILEAVNTAKAGFAEISAAEMLNYAMMEGYADQAFGNMSSAMQSFYDAGGQRSRIYFDMYKAFSIAQTGISTYIAAAAALQPPPVGLGPVWGWALAATVIASGIARAAQIASMQPGSSASGSGGSSPNTSIGSGAQSYANTVSNNQTKSNNVTVIINSEVLAGDSLDSWVRNKLGSTINKALKDGVIDFSGNN